MIWGKPQGIYMAKLPNEELIAVLYDVLMEYVTGESVSEARIGDRHASYRNMDHGALLRVYKKTWANCSAEIQAKFDVTLFDGPQRGGPVRFRHG